jgi:hypothetical protein
LLRSHDDSSSNDNLLETYNDDEQPANKHNVAWNLMQSSIDIPLDIDRCPGAAKERMGLAQGLHPRPV